ncbi:Uncharacterised protein [Mycobacterium tuberculosis]|nr:Uncharacterised protein [Mycobacterium tuberculosis]
MNTAGFPLERIACRVFCIFERAEDETNFNVPNVLNPLLDRRLSKHECKELYTK